MTESTRIRLTRGERGVNGAVRWLADRGIGVAGAQTLTVRGRQTGEPHRVPVNPLTLDSRTYLVAPRGHTDWVRNVRRDPCARLRRGRRDVAVRLIELADAEPKVRVLAAYLSTWGWEVGRLLPAGLSATADHDTLRRHASLLPVFEVVPIVTD